MLKPSTTWLTQPPRLHGVMIAGGSGEISVAAPWMSLCAPPGPQAKSRSVSSTPSDTDAPDSYGLTRDPVADAVDFIMSTSADALPASSAELALVLEQLTLPL